MSSKSMSFKAKINNYAKERHIPAQVVLQNVMFERFLERLSKSEFRDMFVIKGGMLISSIVGLDTRITMDLDATLRNLALTEEKVKDAISKICAVEIPDDVSFDIKSVASIRKDDLYGGYRVRLDAIFENIVTPLSIDTSTGDIITPQPVEYEFSVIMENLPDGGLVDAYFFADIHRPHIDFVHCDDSTDQGFFFTGFMGDFDAVFL